MVINVSKELVRQIIKDNNDFTDEAVDVLLDYYEDVCGDYSAFNPTRLDEEWTEYTTGDIMIEFGYLVEDAMEDYDIEDVIDELECCTSVFRLPVSGKWLVCDW